MNRSALAMRVGARVAAMVGLMLVAACAWTQGPSAASAPGAPANVGRVSGVIEDEQGALIPGARVVLVAAGASHRLTSGTDGRFSFEDIPAGSFTVTASEDGMADGTLEGKLSAAQQMELDPMMLHAGAVVSVSAVTQEEMAAIQVRQEETQRVGGILPNYYVVYDANPQPLPAKLKFELGWKSVIDPANVGFVAMVAGFEQMGNQFPGYGSGPAGYGKRFGAGMADMTVGTLLSGSILPAIFKQDPRYFYRGRGTIAGRTWWALKTTVIARGDNGKWQPAYANVLGSFGGAAVSGLYYPGGEQGGMQMVETGLTALAFDGFANVMQEFVVRHLTPSARRVD